MKSRGSTVLALNIFGEFDSEVAQLMRIQSYVCVLGIDDRGNLRDDVVSDAVAIRLSTQELSNKCARNPRVVTKETLLPGIY